MNYSEFPDSSKTKRQEQFWRFFFAIDASLLCDIKAK